MRRVVAQRMSLSKKQGLGRGAQIWELEESDLFEPFKLQDRIRYRLGLPHPAEVSQSLRSVSNQLLINRYSLSR